MADAMELVVVTPERQILKETVSEVTMPGADGYLGILPAHAPLITELGIGEMTYKTTSGEAGLLAVIHGFAEVLPDRVSVLAETAEFAADIDLARAQQALRRKSASPRPQKILIGIARLWLCSVRSPVSR